MSAVHFIAVGIGGFLGAVARYSISQKLNQNIDAQLPYGTLLVNLIGSFVLGFIVSIGLSEICMLLLGAGFLGAFTTFSTFNKELMLLQKHMKKWLIYFVVTYVGGLCLVFLGFFLGSQFI